MKKFVVACFALSAVSCGAQNSSLSSESGRPISMGLIGDSISTGVLADTQLGGSLSESIKSDIIKHVIGGNYDAALFQKRFSRPDLAAATTDQPWGYRASLAAKHGIDVSQVKVFSAARFGGRYAHVQSEINLLQDLYARENAGQKPDYVTVLLGGNDFCKGRSVEEFATEAESALKLVLSSHPDSRVLFSLVPPLWKLRNHKHTYSYKVNFGISFTMSSKVDDIRKIECDALYKGDVEGKVHAYNGAIRNLVDRYEAVAGGRLFLVEGVADLPIAREHLSFDGFHPSMDGQVTFGEAFERALQQIP